MIFKENKKTIYIGIHGFGLIRSAEYNHLQGYFKAQDLDFITFDLYSTKSDESDWKLWVKRAEIKVTQYIEKGYQVHLIGFSMGGVIASHLASYLQVESLVLLAPSFEYIGISSIKNLASDYISLDKTGRKHYFEDRIPLPEYILSFEALVRNLKKSIKGVKCPLLILQGTLDEYVPTKSAKKAYKMAASTTKRLLFIEDAPHQFHMMKEAKDDVCRLVLLFINKQIVY